jgi:zinc transporter 1/2/3
MVCLTLVDSEIKPRTHIPSDAHGHAVDSYAAHGPETNNASDSEKGHLEKTEDHTIADSALAQIIGVAILEFGVLLHRYL